jgi:hypothetical protein
MRAVLAGLILALAVSTPAAAADDDNDRKQSPSGAFNPTLDHSPIIICAVPDACKIGKD